MLLRWTTGKRRYRAYEDLNEKPHPVVVTVHFVWPIGHFDFGHLIARGTGLVLDDARHRCRVDQTVLSLTGAARAAV
jgi:hypothetical protein